MIVLLISHKKNVRCIKDRWLYFNVKYEKRQSDIKIDLETNIVSRSFVFRNLS